MIKSPAVPINQTVKKSVGGAEEEDDTSSFKRFIINTFDQIHRKFTLNSGSAEGQSHVFKHNETK
jgi:hypothetical protein